MDACESEQAVGKQSTTVTLRPPLVSADNKNGTTRRSRTREVSSRYMSPTPLAATVRKRCPSPNGHRSPSPSTALLPKRAVSAERKRPSTPSTPPSPSSTVVTPRKGSINKSAETLWPSTMRSLGASFQAVPVGKKEKTITYTPTDRTLKPSSNVACKGESPTATKLTPEKRRSPLKGKNSADQSENSKPVDSLPPRLLDQHRWPSRTNGRTPSFPNRSNVSEKVNKNSLLPARRLSLDSKPIQKPVSDILTSKSHVESGKEMLQRPSSSSSSEMRSAMNAAARTQSLPNPRSRPSSPSISRGASPSQGRIATLSSRGSSPARVRPSSPSRQPQDTTSVLSFIADIGKSKKAANDIEDVHQLRMLYNRHLQWRYANARTGAAMHLQKAKAEKMLYDILRIILDLSDSVTKKRSDLQQQNLKSKLYSVLVNQARSLDEWASTERDHTNSLTWAIQDLQATTLRIPVTEGARAWHLAIVRRLIFQTCYCLIILYFFQGDIKSVKGAVCSAVDVMKAMASSLYSILPQVEGMNSLVSELAGVAARERAMLNECESLFASIAALQVEEDSLRTHLLQKKQAWRAQPSIIL